MVFRDNQALGGDTSSPYGGAAAGGGVALRACPSTTVENVVFESNRAEGGSGGDRGGFGIGGGMFTFETTLEAADLTFTNNRAVGGNSAGSSTAGGVRFDGVLQVTGADLSSGGFGIPWGQTRSWSNGAGYAGRGTNGMGTVSSHLPSLRRGNGGNTLAVVSSATGAAHTAP